MSQSPGLMLRAGRAIAFGRHMPAGKIARRVRLELRRALSDRLPLAPPAPAVVERAPQPVLPLFPLRKDGLARDGDDLVFTFLGRPLRMPRGDVDWQAPGPGAADQLWRMNLHYMEYLEGVDDRLWARLVTGWIASNPATRRGCWRDAWNSYALSLRIVVWLQELARRAGRLPDAVVRAAEASAAAQLLFLERNLETDLGGNHLIKNIKALVWGAAYFTGPDAARWRQAGLRLLEDELDGQVLADGMHYERSPSYHCQVLADLAEIRHAIGRDPFAGRLDDALNAMAAVALDLSHPDGGVALFNDAGLGMAYAPAECAAAAARLTGRQCAARGVFALPAAGYYGMRSQAMYLVADCGRIAPDDLPAHGHGDVLSFELSAGGQRVIVDQGVYEYIAGECRQRARSSASHNTLALDGADQADFFGAFRCGRRPGVEALRWEQRPDGFLLEGTHDGFAHLPGRPRHVRRFEATPSAVVITDRLEGRCGRPATIGFLLHPDVAVDADGGDLVLSRGATAVRLRSSLALDVVPAVWWPDMGQELPTRRLLARLAPGEAARYELTVVTLPPAAPHHLS